MIQAKLVDVIGSTEVIKKLLDSPIKGRTAYKIAKLIKRLDEELALFNESRGKLLNKYAVKDENGQPIIENNGFKIALEHVEDFNRESAELLNTSITIDSEPIILEEIENVEFTPNEMLAIEPFIKE